MARSARCEYWEWMRLETEQALRQINQRFYQAQAQAFSQTRNALM